MKQHPLSVGLKLHYVCDTVMWLSCEQPQCKGRGHSVQEVTHSENSPVVEISAGRGHSTGYTAHQLLSVMEKREWYRAVWRTLLLLAALNCTVAAQVRQQSYRRYICGRLTRKQYWYSIICINKDNVSYTVCLNSHSMQAPSSSVNVISVISFDYIHISETLASE